jgi:hypothetical protein
MSQSNLLDQIQNPETLSEPRRSLLGPAPLAHSKQLVAELPTLRQHVGPRPWLEWLEKSHTPNNS